MNAKRTESRTDLHCRLGHAGNGLAPAVPARQPWRIKWFGMCHDSRMIDTRRGEMFSPITCPMRPSTLSQACNLQLEILQRTILCPRRLTTKRNASRPIHPSSHPTEKKQSKHHTCPKLSPRQEKQRISRAIKALDRTASTTALIQRPKRWKRSR